MRNQIAINQVTLLAFLLLITVLAVYLICGIVRPGSVSDVLFMVVMFIALLLVSVAFVVSQNIKYNIKLTETKLNKAIALNNKVKIKYINTVNIIEYMKMRYDVDNSYQLSRLYELYLETKKDKERYLLTTGELNDAVDKLMKMLEKLNLYDSHIWQNEIRALTDPKEMVEMRHRLNTRRQILRVQIAENDEKIQIIEKKLGGLRAQKTLDK